MAMAGLEITDAVPMDIDEEEEEEEEEKMEVDAEGC